MNRRPADPPEWQIRCPWCNASVGARCTSPRGRKLPIDSHDARTTAWNTTRHPPPEHPGASDAHKAREPRPPWSSVGIRHGWTLRQFGAGSSEVPSDEGADDR